MTPQPIDVLIFSVTRPHLAVAVVAVTVLGTVGSVLLREKCGLCGERLRIPLEAHWQLDHAGDPR